MSLDLTILGTETVKALPWAGIVGLFGILVRSRIPMRKMQDASDKSLRNDLLKQIADQEKTHETEIDTFRGDIRRLEERRESQRREYEAKLEYERVTHAGELASFRHKVGNLEQSLNMLLALVESNPEKAGDAAKKVRELREKQENLETAEKDAITAAKINASSPNTGS